MKCISIVIFVFIVIIVDHTLANGKSRPTCRKPRDGQQICTCGKGKVLYDRLKGYKCVDGQVVRTNSVPQPQKYVTLRSMSTPIHQSTRDNKENKRYVALVYNQTSSTNKQQYVPLRNVSVEAWIDSFTADVTLTQIFVNNESNPIEAIYFFPIEENAAVYSFTAEIDDRTIVAELKERKQAEKEYKTAVEQGYSSVLMRQNKQTLDTFTINIGAFPSGKQCRITIKYVTELDLVEEDSIRFVVPTTIAPRYNPSLGHVEISTEYVQKTPYSMTFQAHIDRGENYKITQITNRSHPIDLHATFRMINIVSNNVSLDRDIIIDIDLPKNRPLASISIEKYNDTSNHAILLAFTPQLSDIDKVAEGRPISDKELIFIVDCSGSMSEANGIGLAKEAMLVFIRSLPVGSNFNIIRFGSTYDMLFKNDTLTAVYNETTAKLAVDLTKTMQANFGGTELLEPLKYLKKHPPIKGRTREIFLLTDGEISNTNEVINLCRSMSSDTRIFSFGLGYSPSRALVKGLARATNGYFTIVAPNAKVDTYVGSQFERALQPAIVHARLQWHGLPHQGQQSPQQIPPLYAQDRILVYQLLEHGELDGRNMSVDLIVDDLVISSIQIPNKILHKKDTIRRLAAKAWIQELLHEKTNFDESSEDYDSEEEEEKQETKQQEDNKLNTQKLITELSLHHQILSPYTAFVGVETTGSKINSSQLQVRYVPIQITKDDENRHSFQPSAFGSSMNAYPGAYGPLPMYAHPRGSMQSTSFNRYRGPPPSYSSKTMSDASDDQHQEEESFADIAPAAYSATGPQTPLYYKKIPSQYVTTTRSLLLNDPVRWLIAKQSFDGSWILSENDIQLLTNNSLNGRLQSTITKNQHALTTAFAIAYLEIKQQNQKNLWHTLVGKARKQLLNYALTSTDIQLLINEFQRQLQA